MGIKALKEKQDRFLKDLMIRGMVDQRKIAYAAGARDLPKGEFGLCLLCICGNTLSVYELDIHRNVGKRLYVISLNRISGLKASSFLLNSHLIFQYDGFRYKFVDFGGGKPLIEAVRQEMSRPEQQKINLL